MVAVNYSTIATNLQDYCDLAADTGEDVIVTCPEERSLVMISLDKYNQLTKAAQRAEYLIKLDKSIEQLRAGEGKVHELIEDLDDSLQNETLLLF